MAAATVVTAAPAQAEVRADSTVTVRGTSFPEAGVGFAYVGCDSLHERGAETLAPTIGFGPALPPTGMRSLGYDLEGGSAMGALFSVDSLLDTTTASLAAYAEDGGSGVAYVGYQAPADGGTSSAWFGRADLVLAPGGWQEVDATDLFYLWSKHDMTTGALLEQGPELPSDVATFTAAHGGDAPGLFTLGYGCDGAPFNMDTLRLGSPGDVTTYDLEGMTTATDMTGERAAITAGEQLALRGALRVTEGGTRVPGSSLILEQQAFGTTFWETVDVVDGAEPTVTVEPLRRTLYRWRFVDRPLAQGSVSLPFVVEVAPDVDARIDGDRVVGSAIPAEPGTPVTLWRSVEGPLGGEATEAVARGLVGEAGAFELALPEGRGRFFVTLPAAPGSLAGTSAIVLPQG
ncbi:hypothetical protein SAMN05216561_103187 [Nocardioides psychrotolerans]|uniref:Htaa protein n=1 Tax=Nocardioides psychrotolerans TaxID=1005945 RepID=A0A1I3E287_9ACTN|nr:hypothetical protein SAMN05216561_103187 [Nocardioides psychrotolerans]